MLRGGVLELRALETMERLRGFCLGLALLVLVVVSDRRRIG